MESKKQTAVEWLVDELKNEEGIDFIPTSIFNQAKAMEKEQQIKFANDFLFHDNTDLTAEQYYNETYGN
jgi:7,8-dihydro-6-hydroxymethylpterin-pyrophosphokinase